MMLGTRLERLLMISRERHWLDYATGGFVFLAAVGGIAAAISVGQLFEASATLSGQIGGGIFLDDPVTAPVQSAPSLLEAMLRPTLQQEKADFLRVARETKDRYVELRAIFGSPAN